MYETVKQVQQAPRSVNSSVGFRVLVKPEISILTRELRQSLGGKTLLQCHVTAYPMATVFWEKAGRELQTEKERYEVTVYDDGPNKLVLNLDIKNLRDSDFGIYTCDASNALGQAKDAMTLKREL